MKDNIIERCESAIASCIEQRVLMRVPLSQVAVMQQNIILLLSAFSEGHRTAEVILERGCFNHVLGVGKENRTFIGATCGRMRSRSPAEARRLRARELSGRRYRPC